MKLSDIINYTAKPKLYEEGTAVMWADEYISRQLLNIHLNAEVDLASRKTATIKNTVEWILNNVNKEHLNILDLGCGPGLYSELLAAKGHNVTGVDFSRNSIEYALKEAEKKKLDINYIHENYLKLNLRKDEFDLAILIYTDFGVLLPREREQLLKLISRFLKPGGIFIFDALNDKNIKAKVTPKNWEVSEQGFWKNKPYLALSDSFLYEEEKVILYQHIIFNEQEHVDVYRFWTHHFSHSDLSALLKKYGFTNLSFYEYVLPEGDLWNGDNVTFCVAVNSK